MDNCKPVLENGQYICPICKYTKPVMFYRICGSDDQIRVFKIQDKNKHVQTQTYEDLLTAVAKNYKKTRPISEALEKRKICLKCDKYKGFCGWDKGCDRRNMFYLRLLMLKCPDGNWEKIDG